MKQKYISLKDHLYEHYDENNVNIMKFEKAINEDKKHRYIVFEKENYILCGNEYGFANIYGTNNLKEIKNKKIESKISVSKTYDFLVFDKPKNKLIII